MFLLSISAYSVREDEDLCCNESYMNDT